MPNASPDDDRAHASSAQPADCTVLYVEDHPVNVLLMQALFDKRPGARLVVATSGAAALRAAQAERFDLMLLDLRLPDCHGTELLARLRALPGCDGVPAVAVTAEVTRELSGSSFVEVWHKPLELVTTLARLDRFLFGTPADRAADAASSRTTITAAPGWPWVAGGYGRHPSPPAVAVAPSRAAPSASCGRLDAL